MIIKLGFTIRTEQWLLIFRKVCWYFPTEICKIWNVWKRVSLTLSVKMLEQFFGHSINSFDGICPTVPNLYRCFHEEVASKNDSNLVPLLLQKNEIYLASPKGFEESIWLRYLPQIQQRSDYSLLEHCLALVHLNTSCSLCKKSKEMIIDLGKYTKNPHTTFHFISFSFFSLLILYTG